jgi:outer membrane protein OmpA-like peptidoglycan-associated protein
MKPVYIFVIFILTFHATGQSQAQVKLPVDAGNCAIFNALNPDNTLYCTQNTNLGAPRGLIVTLGGLVSTPDTQQVMAQLPTSNENMTIVKRPNALNIDHKAARSETGYYIHFAFDSDALEKAYRDHLDRLAIVLNTDSMKANCVKITGHTDTVGNTQYNLDLSRRRAQSVYRYLSHLDEIDITRFTIEALGESQPLPDKAGISPYNRRVEFSSKPTASNCKPQS